MKLNIKNTVLALLVVPVLALSFGAPVAFAQGAGSGAAAGGTAGGTASDLDITKGVSDSKGNGQPDTLFSTTAGSQGVFNKIVNVLLYVIGAVSVIMLIIGGIRYTISQGDSNAVSSAKNTILYAIIGIIVAILAYAIVNFVITYIN